MILLLVSRALRACSRFGIRSNLDIPSVRKNQIPSRCLRRCEGVVAVISNVESCNVMSDGVFLVRILESRNIHSSLFLYSHAAQRTYSLLDGFIIPRTGIKLYCKLREEMLSVEDKLPSL